MNKLEALAVFNEYKATLSKRDPLYALKTPLRFVGIGKNRALSLLKHYLQSLTLAVDDATALGFVDYLAMNAPESIKSFSAGIPTDADEATQEIFATVFTPKKTLMATTSFAVDESTANLDEYPKPWLNPRPPLERTTQLTIGDMHGNALKLIYFLIREKILKGITETDYEQLVAIYKKSVSDLTEADLNEFNAILGKASANSVGLLRLMGDTLADRGSNDYFTLKVMARLKELKVPMEILASNHDIEYLGAYQTPTASKPYLSFADSRMSKNQDRSLRHLRALLTKFPKLNSEVTAATESSFIPAVRLISYTLNNDNSAISLYTHAPVGINTIEALAAKFNVKFNTRTAKDLAATIDQINTAVNENGGIATFYQELFTQRALAMQLADAKLQLHAKITAICAVLHLPLNTAIPEDISALGNRINIKLEEFASVINSVHSQSTHELLTIKEQIAELCLIFNIDYQDNSSTEFEKTLTHLRLALTSETKASPRFLLDQLLPELNAALQLTATIEREHPTLATAAEYESDPLYMLIWNRDYDGISRPASYRLDAASKPYSLNFVHGHDHSMVLATSTHIACMDDDLGKYDTEAKAKPVYNHKGAYRVLYTHSPLPKARLIDSASSDEEVSARAPSPELNVPTKPGLARLTISLGDEPKPPYLNGLIVGDVTEESTSSQRLVF